MGATYGARSGTSRRGMNKALDGRLRKLEGLHRPSEYCRCAFDYGEAVKALLNEEPTNCARCGKPPYIRVVTEQVVDVRTLVSGL